MSSKNEPVPSPNTNLGPPDAIPSDSENPIVKRSKLIVSELIDTWSLSRLIDDLGTREQCIAFAEQQHLLPIKKICRVHGKLMKVRLSLDANVGYFVCNIGTCKPKSSISRAKGTWFENVRIDLVHVFYLMYAYAHQWSQETVIWEDILKKQKRQCLSSSTVSDWYKCCQEAVVIYQLEQQNLTGKIGGPGKVVRIYESKFGTRKCNKGKHIEGHWVLGISEDGSEDLRLEVCSENVLLAEDMVPLIKRHVTEGTTIYTSSCKAFDCLSDYGYIQKTFNQKDSEDSSVPDDASSVPRSKPEWHLVKQFYSKKNYNDHQNLADFMVEYLFRRNIKKYHKDPFIELITVIKHVYKIKN